MNLQKNALLSERILFPLHVKYPLYVAKKELL